MTADKAQTNHEEYLERFQRNSKITGYGIGRVYQTVACPFCAAPDFARYEILQMQEVMSQPHECKECGRAAKLIFAHSNTGVAFEMVQTKGDDQPAWLNMPPIRRAP